MVLLTVPCRKSDIHSQPRQGRERVLFTTQSLEAFNQRKTSACIFLKIKMEAL
uniref:Uncharacterized protein n=1 Tax=Anguilla anguilla TaxID=7936 RepID=A0A0E9WN09_ANGAN